MEKRNLTQRRNEKPHTTPQRHNVEPHSTLKRHNVGQKRGVVVALCETNMLTLRKT